MYDQVTSIDYGSCVKPFSDRFKLITLEDNELEKVNSFVRLVVKEKNKEEHYKSDNNSKFKRFYNGIIGEVAIEKLLGMEGKIIDWSVGNSNTYHKPDLSAIGLKVGIKTVEYGLFPVIFKISYYPEIINIVYKKKYVYVCGIALKDTLNKYQSNSLIKDKNLKKRSTKTGFYGFQHLKQFSSIKELKDITLYD